MPHAILKLSIKQLLIAMAMVSIRHGMKESFKMFSLCCFRLDILSVRPALHRITQNDMFLYVCKRANKEQVPECAVFRTKHIKMLSKRVENWSLVVLRL